MRTPGDKKAATFRLSTSTKTKLQTVAHRLSRSESDLVEASILEYIKNHNLDTQYLLKLQGEHLVLLKMEGGKPEVVEVRHLNGVPISSIHQELVAKVGSAVSLELPAGD